VLRRKGTMLGIRAVAEVVCMHTCSHVEAFQHQSTCVQSNTNLSNVCVCVCACIHTHTLDLWQLLVELLGKAPSHDDDLLCSDDVEVTTKCPLSMLRIQQPCRGKNCKHPQVCTYM
jgi:hypothetical protein